MLLMVDFYTADNQLQFKQLMFKRLDDYERMLQTDTAVSKLNVIYASIHCLYTVDKQLMFKRLIF